MENEKAKGGKMLHVVDGTGEIVEQCTRGSDLTRFGGSYTVHEGQPCVDCRCWHYVAGVLTQREPAPVDPGPDPLTALLADVADIKVRLGMEAVKR